MNQIRFGIDQFHKHMNYDNNTLIIAPRQSGKTYALFRKFLEEENSVFFVPNRGMRYHIDSVLVDMNRPDKLDYVYTMNNPAIRRRRASAVFIDEIDYYDGDIQDFWGNVLPAVDGRIISVTTPAGRRHPDQYHRVFLNIFDMKDDRFMRTVTQGATSRMKTEHFDMELFKI